METSILKVTPRNGAGSKQARRERQAGRVPIIIYGHGEAPESYTVNLHDLQMEIAKAGHTLSLNLDGEARPYLIRDVQYDYLGDTPIHVDLQRVDMQERVRVQVSIELRGVPKGVAQGGVLEHKLASIEVDCRAIDIPGKIVVLVSDLEVGGAIHVRELSLPEGVVALSPGDDVVVAVRVLAEEEEPVVAETEAVAEPERIGRVRAEEEPKPA